MRPRMAGQLRLGRPAPGQSEVPGEAARVDRSYPLMLPDSEEWEERAAILEYDAGLDRAEAERRAGPIDGVYLLDSGYACGGVTVRGGRIVEAAPIFRKLIGQDFEAVRSKYRALFACAL